MSNTSSSSSGGIGFGGALTLLFIGLKLTNQIDWSWWWVLSPIWIVLALILVILLVAGGVAAIMAIVEARGNKKRLKKIAELNKKKGVLHG